jgi:hypothetical protein
MFWGCNDSEYLRKREKYRIKTINAIHATVESKTGNAGTYFWHETPEFRFPKNKQGMKK